MVGYRVGQRIVINDRLTVEVVKTHDDGNTISVDYTTAEIKLTQAEYDALSDRSRAQLDGVVTIIEGDEDGR